MNKRKYKDKISAMLALCSCRNAGRHGNPNRKEKRIYFENNNWYLTSKEK